MILSQAEWLLLETVRGKAHRRQSAWKERRRLYPLQTFPNPAADLLCLVAGEWPDQEDERGRLQGILRHTWLKNQRKIALARSLGEEIVWLGDLALLLNCYRNVGHRPIHALEGWVERNRLDQVSRQLSDRGLALVWRGQGYTLHECGESLLSIRLLTRLLPNRENRVPATRSQDGLRWLAPEQLLLRLCLARPHHAWWIADLTSLVPQLPEDLARSAAQDAQAGLAVRRTLRRINRLGLEPLPYDLGGVNISPGEWLEPILGERGLSAYLLARLERWWQLPGACWAYWKLRNAHSLPL